MKVGFVGFGKLGCPVCVAIDSKGHEVMAYDILPELLQKDTFPRMETGPGGEPFLPLLQKSGVRFGSLKEVVDHAEILFVAVQTPHHQCYDGKTPLPPDRVDFNYAYLVSALRDLSILLDKMGKALPVVIISTVLPGTIRREVLPAINEEYLKVCYSPQFIAMGTVMRDYLFPEFVLFGVKDEGARDIARRFYATITDASFLDMSLESAEATKVAYNAFITAKVQITNMWMELCHKTPGANIDEVMGALQLATRRIISSAYMRGGMGDGGGCHPRDAIALSSLCRRLGVYDLFEDVMLARQSQTEWLADLICQQKLEHPQLQIVVLGKAFKADSNLMEGSPALLLVNMLERRGQTVVNFDPLIDGTKLPPSIKAIYFVATRHSVFQSYKFPVGSIVIDPHRYIQEQEGIALIRVGVGV